jgi:tetratricopeptide (TPR) repeat protein
MPIDTFRKRIWQPIRDFIRAHDLEEEIDVIAYSADFPYAVDFKSDLGANKIKRYKYMGTKASLTSLTYFARRVEVGDVGYLGRNHYFAEFAGPKVRKDLDSSPISISQLNEKEYKRLRKAGKQALGRRDYNTALEIYRKMRDGNPLKSRAWYDIGRTLAAAGKKEEALAALGEAVDRGWSKSLLTQRDRYLKSLHRDPRFQGLIKRMETTFGPFQLPHGFRNHYVWSNSDLNYWDPRDDLDRYYLSTMLAYTGVRGNSLPEVQGYLTAAAASDGTQPAGTVYLLDNPNIRSETRQPLFAATVTELVKRGRKAEILSKGKDKQSGIIPIGKRDIIGAVAGYPDYKWSKSGSRLLPGAIAETLTSYGGDFNRAKQTKLTEFLRYGAAGSSGAVMEPFSFQEKFPVPLLHVYYADGCSLAESFYQSLFAPYQLIIVGDPLAQPFARFAQVQLRSPDPTRVWSGSVTIVPDVRAAPRRRIEKVELWVDGQFVAEAPMGKPISWDTRGSADGYHELRLVAIEDSMVETRSSARFSVSVDNTGRRVGISDITRAAAYGDDIVVSGMAVGVERVGIYRGYRQLGEAEVRGGRWRAVINSADLGSGPASLQARTSENGISVQSAPIETIVGEAVRIGPVADLRSPEPGIKASVRLRNGEVHFEITESVDELLKKLKKQKKKPDFISIEGYFEISTPGFYQLLVAGNRDARISINDRAALETRKSRERREFFLPLGLEAGWHKLQLDLENPGRGAIPRIFLAGAEVTKVLSGKNLFHGEAGGAKPN